MSLLTSRRLGAKGSYLTLVRVKNEMNRALGHLCEHIG